MPRVLTILNRLIIGGPSVVATALAHYMQPDFETLMVVGGKDDHEQDATFITDQYGIRPVIIPEMRRAINWKNDRAAYRKLKEVIREYKPDIVHTHAAKSGALGRMAARACGVPVIVHTFHGHVFHSYFSPLKTKMFIGIERWLSGRTSGIIALSNLQKNELVNDFRIADAKRIRVIPLGLDLEKFQEEQDKKRSAFREQFELSDEEIAIGIVGRIVPVKNHELFVRSAVAALKKSDRKLRFFIIGDGENREQLESLFATEKLDYTYHPENPRKAVFTCTSWQKEMDTVYAGLDLVVLTSHNEGTPVALIEAQAAAKPVIATDVGGVADTFLDGKSGFLVPKADPIAFADAMLRLTNDSVTCRSFGEKGREFANLTFSSRQMVDQTMAYYRELLAANGNNSSSNGAGKLYPDPR